MSRGQALTLALLAFAAGTWWLAQRLLGWLELEALALPVATVGLLLALGVAEAGLNRLHR